MRRSSWPGREAAGRPITPITSSSRPFTSMSLPKGYDPYWYDPYYYGYPYPYPYASYGYGYGSPYYGNNGPAYDPGYYSSDNGDPSAYDDPQAYNDPPVRAPQTGSQRSVPYARPAVSHAPSADGYTGDGRWHHFGERALPVIPAGSLE